MKSNYLVWLGIIVGVVIGYLGIPVLVPSTSAHWVWTTPLGWRTESVFVFGTLGYLVGSCVDVCIQKNSKLIWSYGVTSLAILIGLIGFYRQETANNDTMWGLVANGLSRTDGVSRTLTRGASLPDQGISLITAASDIGSADQYFGRQGLHTNMDNVASALAQAGYYLTSSQDPTQIEVAEKFIDQSGPIIEAGLRNLRYISDPTSLQAVIKRMSAIIPQQLQQGWPVN